MKLQGTMSKLLNQVSAQVDAKQLAGIWPRYHGHLVGEGRLVGHPCGDKNPRIVIEGSFRNYFPKN